jgi:hypothetical protein
MNIKQFSTRGLASILLTLFILSATHAEIPFNEALGMYQTTQKGKETISPFWAMVAVHGKLLERIRLFGYYRKQEDMQGRLFDTPLDKDSIAELLLTLFPSPDGIQFVPNARDDYFKELSKPGNIKYINDIIETLLKKEEIPPQEAKRAKELREKKEREAKINNIKNIVKMLTTSKSTITNFSKILVTAYEQESTYANPNNNEQQRYPTNIVAISLLSFLVKVADNNTSNLNENLPLLMTGSYSPLRNINKEFYDKYKGHFAAIIKDFNDFEKVKPEDVELAFFLAKGFEAYENIVAEPIKYAQNISIANGTNSFSDCGETSLRNFFTLLLSAGNGGIISTEKLKALEEKIFQNRIESISNRSDLSQHTIYQQFKTFMTKHLDITYGTSSNIHSAWAEIVSNLNEGSDKEGINRVQYGNKKIGAANEESYEIKSNVLNAEAKGIFNMFNVIGRIIPDKILNKPWDKDEKVRHTQLVEKLDHLCDLFSSDNMIIGWKNESTNSKINPSDSFMSIVFTIQDATMKEQDAFRWIFQKGHFDIERISTVNSDWRADFTDKNYQNEWLASLFTNSLSNQRREVTYDNLAPLTVIYNASLTKLEGIRETIEIILKKQLKNFYPLINRWVQHSIFTHAENPNFLIDMIEFIATLPTNYIDAEHQKEIIKDGMYVAKAKELLKKKIAIRAFINKKFKAAVELIKAGADPNKQVKESGDTLFHLAIDQKNIEIIDSLIKVGADADIKNKADRTPLNLAISKSDAESPQSLEMIRMLVRATKNIDLQNQYGNTLLHLAIAQNKIEIFKILLDEAKPNINLPNNIGQTPLALARDKNRETAIEILRRLGATE